MVIELLPFLTKCLFRQRIGRIADFCALCRTFEPAELIEVRFARPLEHFGGGGKSVEHVRVCERCGTELPAERSDYVITKDLLALDTDGILTATQPGARERWAERLDLEERAMNGRATPEEREVLIAEPIFALDRIFQVRRCTGAIGHAGRILVLTSFAVLALGFGAWLRTGEVSDTWPYGAAAGVCIVAAFISARRAPKAAARKILVRQLLRALRPLEPRPEELSAVFKELKSDGVKLVRYVEPEWLEAKLRELPADQGRFNTAA